jgi:hypothetical protein
LDAIGETIDDSELMRMTLKGFMKKWTLFIKGIVASKKLLDWMRLWDDFVQEELNGGQLKVNDENIALSS